MSSTDADLDRASSQKDAHTLTLMGIPPSLDQLSIEMIEDLEDADSWIEYLDQWAYMLTIPTHVSVGEQDFGLLNEAAQKQIVETIIRPSLSLTSTEDARSFHLEGGWTQDRRNCMFRQIEHYAKTLYAAQGARLLPPEDVTVHRTRPALVQANQREAFGQPVFSEYRLTVDMYGNFPIGTRSGTVQAFDNMEALSRMNAGALTRDHYGSVGVDFKKEDKTLHLKYSASDKVTSVPALGSDGHFDLSESWPEVGFTDKALRERVALALMQEILTPDQDGLRKDLNHLATIYRGEVNASLPIHPNEANAGHDPTLREVVKSIVKSNHAIWPTPPRENHNADIFLLNRVEGRLLELSQKCHKMIVQSDPRDGIESLDLRVETDPAQLCQPVHMTRDVDDTAFGDSIDMISLTIEVFPDPDLDL